MHEVTSETGIPRPEHPRPQWVRPRWLNLNGEWEFEVDPGDSGLERGLLDRELPDRIVVPFAPESVRSGIKRTDFMEAVWYRRTVDVPADWQGCSILLHFGAVDHDATVWVDGVEVARHRGGFTGFTADLSGVAAAGRTLVVVVRARDSRHESQARGKQAATYANWDAFYTRTTGMWQTVWLEAVPELHLRRPHIVPNLARGAFSVEAPVSANRPDHRVRATLLEHAGPGAAVVAVDSVRADLDLAPRLLLDIRPKEVQPWSVDDPHLYGLRLELIDPHGDVVDTADSYAGLRSLSIDGNRLRLNGRAVFQRLVLDQGYWPDSLMTAPSDADLVRDIELGRAAGFNGARLHQRVVEERYLYHADRLGYLVWAEFGDWGVSGRGPVTDHQQLTVSLVTQWLEAVDRDRNHPSIVGWCPLNETHQTLHDRITVLDDATAALFRATKAADPTRPVIDASGYSHRVLDTDVYDAHSYEQEPGRFAELNAGLAAGQPFVNRGPDGAVWSLSYRGQPYFVSEFGGIWWNPDQPLLDGQDRHGSWGYGLRIADEEEFHERFRRLVDVLLDDSAMFGYCYTQLTDVFQEENGIYRFDRSTKLDVGRIRAAQSRSAAVELLDMGEGERRSEEAG